tara:strand:+ start:8 stop:163 length:156 start_codon:yes stop_codon:yes gene_type:complete
MRNNIAKKSVSKSSNNPAALQNTSTKNSTEKTGFRELITIIPQIIAKLENM